MNGLGIGSLGLTRRRPYWNGTPTGTIVDCAGGSIGGMRRYLDELDEWILRQGAPVCLIGYGRRLGARWLLERELQARRRQPIRAIALNNVSFVAAGQIRTVLVHNAIHFLRPGELEDKRSQLRTVIAKGPIVRATLQRADRVIVPSTSMADRVASLSPQVAGRLELLPNPVGPLPFASLARRTECRILCPVVDGPHKRLDFWLGDAIAALRDLTQARRRPVHLDVTLSVNEARRQGLPSYPWISYLGALSTVKMREHQEIAHAIFYPADVESFGYPLAEARVNRHPVVAPDAPLCREVAGDALVGYTPGDRHSLVEAFERALDLELLPLERNPFDPDIYFAKLFDS